MRERHAHLFLVGLGLRLDRDGDDGLRKVHRLEDDRVVLVADRVARLDVLEADGRRDVARPDLLDLLALVGVHLEEPADPLAPVLGRVEDAGAGVEVARVDPEERELADEGVRHDLEDQGGEWCVVGGRALELGADVVVSDHGADVQRRREVIDHRVQQLLDALVLECRAADHGLDVAGDRGAPQGGPELGDLDLSAVEVLLQQGVVGLGDGLDQDLAVLVGLVLHVRRNVHDVEGGALRVVVEVDRLHRDEVDDARGGRPRCPRGSGSARACAFSFVFIISTQRGKFAPTRSILLTKAMRGTP